MHDDCFAKKGKTSCKALTVAVCNSEHCSFYKSLQGFKEAQYKAMTHLSRLDENAQKYIADKYYRGKLIWMEV